MFFLKRNLPILLLFAIPLVFLSGAYIHMCLRYEKLWLFNTVVHENGRYTLFEVILYYRHFLWEVPIKIIYSLFIVGAFYFYGKPQNADASTEVLNVSYKRIIFGGLIAFCVVLIAIVMTGYDVGFKDAFAGLLQFRTHETRPLALGSHWRNHFLSNIVLFSATTVSILAYRLIDTGHWIKRKSGFLFYVALGIFVFLCFVFGFNNDPFTVPSYLGHQLREIFGTDLSITMPMCLGILVFLERKYTPKDSGGKKMAKQNTRKNMRHLIPWSILAAIPSIFLIVKVLCLDIKSEIEKFDSGIEWSILDIFAWHFFEHSLDYIFVGALVYSIYLITLKFESKKSHK